MHIPLLATKTKTKNKKQIRKSNSIPKGASRWYIAMEMGTRIARPVMVFGGLVVPALLILNQQERHSFCSLWRSVIKYQYKENVIQG